MNIFVIRNAQFDNNASMNRVVNALSEKDHCITVISRSRETNRFNNYRIKVNEKSINILQIGLKSKYGKNIFGIFNIILYNIKLLRLLVKYRKQIDVIHSYDLDTGLISKCYATLFHKKLVYHIADFYADSRGNPKKFLYLLIKKLEFRVIKKANVTILCSEERVEQIKGSKPKKIKIVHNAPIIDSFEKKYFNYDTPIKITYIGSLSNSRFIMEIIETIGGDNRFILTIGGIGYLSNVIDSIQKKCNNLNFIGKVDYSKSLEIYNESHIMIAMYNPKIKNHKYAAPNKIYESMALGKPIIVAKGTGLAYLVENYDFGWVIDYNTESLKALLENISKDKKQIIIKSKNALRAFEMYNWLKVKKEIQDLYSEL